MAESISLNHQFLVGIGLGHLEREQQKIVLDKLYKVLQLRVGQAMHSSLTKTEQATFDRLLKEDNEETAQTFLQQVVPDYSYVVRSELEFIASSIVESINQGRVALSEEQEGDHA